MLGLVEDLAKAEEQSYYQMQQEMPPGMGKLSSSLFHEPAEKFQYLLGDRCRRFLLSCRTAGLAQDLPQGCFQFLSGFKVQDRLNQISVFLSLRYRMKIIPGPLVMR